MDTINIRLEIPNTMPWTKKEFTEMVKACATALLNSATATNKVSEKQKAADFQKFFDSLSGDWGGAEKTANEVAEELRSTRYFEDKDLTW